MKMNYLGYLKLVLMLNQLDMVIQKKKIQKYMHHENKMYLNEILKYLILKYMKF